MASSQSLADVTTAEVPLTWNEALSGIFGSISLACWIFVFVPQLWENYVSQSAAGLSIVFVLIWLVGDITNLAGAVLAGLVPTVIAVAVWYLIAEMGLIGQAIYYGRLNARKAEQKRAAHDDSHSNGNNTNAQPDLIDENAPLLQRSSNEVDSRAGLVSTQDEPSLKSSSMEVLKNIGAVLAVFLLGAGGWAIAYASGAWKPTPAFKGGDELNQDQDVVERVAIAFGYVSAVCYLGARIPQIIKNYREKSCEGLSVLFFIFSLFGNLTFGAQIFFHSLERRYILVNLPWLIGSLGTIAEDVTIFVQFRIYKKAAATRVSE